MYWSSGQKVRVSRFTTICLGAILLALAAAQIVPQAQGVPARYTFTVIFGPGSGGAQGAGFAYVPPSINNDGQVVFRPDCNRLIFGDGGSPLTTTAPSPCGNLPIAFNNRGVVALHNAQTSNPFPFWAQILTTTGDGLFTVVADQANLGTMNGFGAFFSINDNSTIAWNAGTYILARPNGDPAAPVVVVSDPTVVTSLGLIDGGSPALNNVGAVAFANPNFPGGRVVLNDGGQLSALWNRGPNTGTISLNNLNMAAFNASTQIIVVDGGPLPRAPARVVASDFRADPASQFVALEQPSLNDNGTVAFSATLAGGVRGIFNGPDATINKIVQVGDVLPGGVVVQQIGFSREGLNDRGQIAFSALTNLGQFVFRADPAVLETVPPGSTGDNPIPPINATPPWQFHLRQARGCAALGGISGPLVHDVRCITPGRSSAYIDPPAAVGYTYAASPGTPNFAGVVIPNALPGGDSTFEVEYGGFVSSVSAGTLLDFTDQVPEGVPTFTLRGIDVAENLDPTSAFAFVTGLMWMDGFDGVVTMTPILNPVDSTAPLISGVPGNVVAEATSAAGALLSYVTPTATDDHDGPVAVTCAPGSGSLFALGTTAVSCHATDAAGNGAIGGFTVLVQDTAPPSIAGVPGGISAAATQAAGAAVTYASPTATDIVSGNVPVSCAPVSGSVFPISTTTVQCSATDGAGNVASAGFTVTVSPPVVRSLSGSGYLFPETPTYRATFSVTAATGPLSPSGSVRYLYTRTRLTLISTSITVVSVTGPTGIVEGTGAVNGVAGYRFRLEATDGAPDAFAITIFRPDGSVYHTAGGALAGGALTLSP